MVLQMPQTPETPLRLGKAPIVEAIFDLTCSMPEGFEVQKIEGEAHALLKHRYPTVRPTLLLEQSFVQHPGKEPAISSKQILRGYQFASDDGKRIIQFRSDGFSFNKLAPYTVLDDYLPEIEESWKVFLRICKPSLVTRVSLRNINRISVKADGTNVQLDSYLKIGPHLHDEKNLTFTGFLNNHQALEVSTGNRVNVITTVQGITADSASLILDIEAYRLDTREQEFPLRYGPKIFLLIRSLKDRVFSNTLTESCLKSFEPL